MASGVEVMEGRENKVLQRRELSAFDRENVARAIP
jgi:hypothetical protein